MREKKTYKFGGSCSFEHNLKVSDDRNNQDYRIKQLEELLSEKKIEIAQLQIVLETFLSCEYQTECYMS